MIYNAFKIYKYNQRNVNIQFCANFNIYKTIMTYGIIHNKKNRNFA